MNGFEKRAQQKKEAIIKAAQKLFSQRGFRDVSIKEIANLADVSPVSIYNYFQDKNNLAHEVLTRELDDAIALYDDILSADIPFLQKLERIMQEKENVAARITNSRFSPTAWQDPAMQKIYREAAQVHARSIYKRFIQQGKLDGAISADIPDEAVLDFMLSTVNIMLKEDFPSSSLDYKRGLFRLFLYGLVGENLTPDYSSNAQNPKTE